MFFGSLLRRAALATAFCLAGASLGWAANVTLAWNPSSSTNVVAYAIHYGGQSGVYTNRVSLGNVTSGTVTGLLAGRTYFFAATATDSAGRESDYSNEVSYLVPDTANVVTVAAADASAGEPASGLGSGTFTFTRSGSVTGALTIAFTLSGTATPGADYTRPGTNVTFSAGASTATLRIDPLDDAITESTETVVLTLTGGSGYTVGSPASASVNLADDDQLPLVTVAATDASAGEPGTGQGTGTFTFSRTGSTASSLLVNFATSGTATSATDFSSLGSSVTFPAGSATIAKVLTILDDAFAEPDESVSVSLVPGTGYTVANPSTATVLVKDDDTLSLQTVLDTPGWNWSTGGNTPIWYGQTNLSHDGIDAARSGAIAHNQTNWIETTVTGPGTLTFWWRVSSETNYDYVRFFVNGSLMSQRSGEGAWNQATYTLGSGTQRLRWDYRKDPGVVAGQDAAWIDQVAFVPTTALTVASVNPATGVAIAVSPNDNQGLAGGATTLTRYYPSNVVVTLTAPATAGGNAFQKWQKDGVDVATTPSTTVRMDQNHTMTAVYAPSLLTLASALDAPSWAWSTGGNTPSWFPQTNEAHDGIDAARSGAIAHNQTNWIETTVTGPGTLTFWWRVSSETNYDYVRFFVNGTLMSRRSGEGAWSQATYTLGSGTQRLRWDYRKDPSVVAGQDAAWIDQVAFVPSTALTVASVNPASGVAMAVSPTDNQGFGGGATTLTRYYPSNVVVTLTAPSTAGGNAFQKWQKDGVDVATTPSTTVRMDQNHTMTAVYAPLLLTLAGALDAPSWAWSTGGNTPSWFPQTNVTHDGIDAARSGAITHNQTNWIETTVTGPGTLTFWWRVSSETNYDYVRFFVNGTLMSRRSGEGAWSQATYTLGSGTQRLRWDYRKDPSVVAGQDAAWIDQVSLVATTSSTGDPRPGGDTNTGLPPGFSLVARFAADGSLELKWPTVAGFLYTVERTLDGSTWEPVHQILGDGEPQAWSVAADLERALFRIRAASAPDPAAAAP